MMIRSVDFWTQ